MTGNSRPRWKTITTPATMLAWEVGKTICGAATTSSGSVAACTSGRCSVCGEGLEKREWCGDGPPSDKKTGTTTLHSPGMESYTVGNDGFSGEDWSGNESGHQCVGPGQGRGTLRFSVRRCQPGGDLADLGPLCLQP